MVDFDFFNFNIQEFVQQQQDFYLMDTASTASCHGDNISVADTVNSVLVHLVFFMPRDNFLVTDAPKASFDSHNIRSNIESLGAHIRNTLALQM